MPRRARKGALVVPLAITLVWASAIGVTYGSGGSGSGMRDVVATE